MPDRIARIEACARRLPRLAIQLFKRLGELARTEGDTTLALDALYRLFFTMERLGLAQELLDELYHGLELAEVMVMPLHAGRMLEAIGRIRYTQGAYRDAVKYWTRCVDLCALTGDTRVLVGARIGLGQIYDAIGDSESGARFHRDAGDLLGPLDDPYLISKQAINLAVNQIAIGHTESARELLRHARTVASRGGIPEYVAEAYWHLGIVALEAGDLALATREVTEALAFASECGYEWLHGAALISLAEIQVRQGATAAAIDAYLAALAHANGVDSRTQQAACCAALSIQYEMTGDAAMALAYARQHEIWRKELEALSAIDQFRELREYDLSEPSPVELLLALSADDALEAKSPADALQQIAEAARVILQLDFVCIWLRDETRETLNCVALSGPSGLGFSRGACLSASFMPVYWRTLRNLQEPLLARDSRLHPAAAQIDELANGCQLKSVLEIPLRRHGQQCGVLSVGQRDRQRNWSAEDVLFASHLATLVRQVSSRADV